VKKDAVRASALLKLAGFVIYLYLPHTSSSSIIPVAYTHDELCFLEYDPTLNDW
jgi:hypothetical protein